MGVVVYPLTSIVHVLFPTTDSDSMCQWKSKPIKLAQRPTTQLGESIMKESKQSSNLLKWTLMPKIVQVNRTDIHFIGGKET